MVDCPIIHWLTNRLRTSHPKLLGQFGLRSCCLSLASWPTIIAVRSVRFHCLKSLANNTFHTGWQNCWSMLHLITGWYPGWFNKEPWSGDGRPFMDTPYQSLEYHKTATEKWHSPSHYSTRLNTITDQNQPWSSCITALSTSIHQYKQSLSIHQYQP